MNVKYPVYVISKGRADQCLTARFLAADGIPFQLVVEEPEAEVYAGEFIEQVTVLPFINRGAVAARNWCWEDSIARGAERHWILDDNIRQIQRWHKATRTTADSGLALGSVEEFTDRYENIGISGLNYVMFGTGTQPPFTLNAHVYSCLLVKNDMSYRWRGQWNADTDLCLQVLSGGLCTVLVNAFLIQKVTTMVMKGGNSERYQGDGRLKMARSLEHDWPGVVAISRRYGRPQHVVNWRRFVTPLRRRTDIDWDEIENKTVDLKQRRTRPAAKLHTFKT